MKALTLNPRLNDIVGQASSKRRGSFGQRILISPLPSGKMPGLRTFASILYFLFIFSACTQKPNKPHFNFPENINFNRHIAPIIHEKCMPCHHPGGGGTFDLITYKDVAKRSKMVKKVTGDRYMPPWPADPTYTSFVGERFLTDSEIIMLARWSEEGALEGPGKMPKPPVFGTGSLIGKPDLVLTMRDSVLIKGVNLDQFMVIKVPFEIPRDTFIRVIEFVPGNRALVHHMNGHLINYQDGKKKDVFSGEFVVRDVDKTNMNTYKLLDIANDDGTFPALTPSVSNYLPGVSPAVYPEGIGGYYMSKKGLLLMKNMHYGPTPIDAYDQSHFNIFFASGPPKRPTREMILGTLGVSPVVPPLIITPDTIMTVQTNFRLPIDISILTINPHMHLIGRSFLAYAIKPDGDTIPLIRIRQWDFLWQYFYTFKKMLKIPRGSVIHAEGLYDNTLNNPNNPFDPPRTVIEPVDEDMKTTDEMFQLIITYLPYHPGDEDIDLEHVSLDK